MATSLPAVDEVELNETWLVMAGGEPGQYTRGRLELRRRANPEHVTATLRTSYRYGRLGCLELDRNQLLWADFELVVSDLDPGPPGRWSLWQRDLTSGAQHRLAKGLPADSSEDTPCPAAGAGYAAWNLNGRVIVRNLATRGTVTYADEATPVGITPSGLVEASWPAHGLQLSLRAGDKFASRRPLVTVSRGTSLAVGQDRVLVFAVDPASGSADAELVSTCQLPDCSALTELRRDPTSGPGVVGNGFAAWNHGEDAPALVRFDGGTTPALAQGYVPFQTLAAFDDTFVYGTQQRSDNLGATGPTTIHLVRITRPSG